MNRSGSLHRMCAVGDCPTRAQRRSDENGFSDLLIRRAKLSRLIRMELDAIRALRREGDRECHQFLVLSRNRSLSQGGLIERYKRAHGFRRMSLEILHPV